MDEVAGVVVAHRDLLEHDAALDVDVLRRDGRVQHDVGDDVDRERQVAVEHRGVEAGVLLLGEGVELAAHGVHGASRCRAPYASGALEQQVLQEVAGAGQGRRLVARADGHPHPDAGAAHAGHRLGDDAQAAGQRRAGDHATAGRPGEAAGGGAGSGGRRAAVIR